MMTEKKDNPNYYFQSYTHFYEKIILFSDVHLDKGFLKLQLANFVFQRKPRGFL